MSLTQSLRQKIKHLPSSRVFPKALVFVYFILALSVLYHLYYAHRVIPGVTVGGVALGGKTFDQAVSALSEYEKQANKEITLTFNGEEYKVSSEDIGLVYDTEGTVLKAFEVGRTGNIFRDAKDKIAGVFKNIKVSAYYDYSDEKLSSVLSEAKVKFNTIAHNASVKLDNGKVIITPENEGKKVLDDALYSSIISSFDEISFGSINLPSKKVVPKITQEDIKPLLPSVEKIVANTITVTSKNKKWILKPEQIMSYVSFQKDKQSGKVEVSLDEPKFEALVVEISNDVNELPRGKVTGVSDKKVTDFKIIQDGIELDKKAFVVSFRDAFYNSKKSVEVPLISVSVPSDKEKFGIIELLGEGSSTYKGSIPGRIKNLTLAAERTNGVLVAPGDTYSMNNSVGEISAETGYDVAYIIKDGRTVLGSGGGVCQTSTTLFRAVLNSGLPIVMRYPHAYRVSYYEQDRPVGFDAAIFQPSWDFQFKNDTEHYILVQSEADVPNYSLTFKIYGTSDGRSVQITEPEVTNQSPPPPALYQDDPTLAKGVVRQVDFPAWGAKVKFSRTVKRGDETLFVDTFESRYQPWRAVYLVGTKE